MEKMVAIINDNLRNVINGIKEHKLDLENTLDSTVEGISQKVKEAHNYKDEVTNSRIIISTLEQEITDLENDLSDLTKKFSSEDFKEILSAGNKEIKRKIKEKRQQINEQGQLIIDLTEKAKVLKQELIDLKEKKITTEENLNNCSILENYFEYRINEIINYAEDNVDELEFYQTEIPQTELMSAGDRKSLELDSMIDGTVFEEIDEISVSEPDEDLIRSALENPDSMNINYEDSPVKREEIYNNNTPEEELGIATTSELEEMISEARSILERNAQKFNIDNPDEAFKVTEEKLLEVEHEMENVLENANEDEEDVIDLVVEEDLVNDDEININLDEEDSPLDPNLIVDFNGNVVDINNVPKPNPRELHERLSKYGLGETDIEEPVSFSVGNEGSEVESTVNDIQNLINENEEVEDFSDIEMEVTRELSVVSDEMDKEIEQINNDDSVVTESSFTNFEAQDFDKNLADCGLEKALFGQDDLILLQTGFDVDTVKKYLEIYRSNGLDENNLYQNARALMYVTPESLDRFITLAKSIGATEADINLVYNVIDKVNINKLEQEIMTTNDAILTRVLYNSMNSEFPDVIGSKLGLTEDEVNTLKEKTTPELYNLINAFADIVLINYNEIKKLNVDNLSECITKYPTRFTYEPSKFHEIIDKYDTDDLIRCINKNAAVIDKL